MKIYKYCIIGLGHFGMSLSIKLAESGAEVIAIDKKMELVEQVKDKVTFAAQLDSTDESALRSQGVEDMDAIIVAIGEGFEASLKTTAILQEIGVKRILNRVITPIHERLLRLMGITELLYPEAEAASHLSSRLMIPGLLESFRLSEDYSIYEIFTPKKFIGQTLVNSDLREKYSLNLVTVKRIKEKKSIIGDSKIEGHHSVGVPGPDFIFREKDVLVLFGKRKDFKKLIEETDNQ